MDYVQLSNLKVSRFILGANPFSGFSHQGPETDLAMKQYYTTEVLKQTIHQAESLGVNTMVARTDHHISRLLFEYWDQGGNIQWFAQTCPEFGHPQASVTRAASGGARACFIHGGVMDHLLAQGQLDDLPSVVETIREKGMLAGIAGHNPGVFEWAEDNLDVDFYMCSYYNSAHRDERAEHVSGMKEWFLPEDRRLMTELIQTLARPVIHYKILAAGRTPPAEAFAWVARSMRPTDAVCVGVYTRDRPDMIAENIELLHTSLQASG